MYIELVQGLGETLVGNYPGTALRCVAAKAALPKASGSDAPPPADAFEDAAVRIVGYASKSAALLAADGAPGLIFRSDSNAEDQEGCGTFLRAL